MSSNLKLTQSLSESDSLPGRVTMLTVMLVPLGGLVAIPVLLWGWGFHWVDLWLMITMYCLTVLGITVGFHRLFVHRSFETYTWLKIIFAILGSMAVQGPLFQWVARHRRHHQHSDTVKDPHSPQYGGKGFVGVIKGFWHAHIGWLYKRESLDEDCYIHDLKHSQAFIFASRLFPLWVLLSLLLPTILGGMLTLSWRGALTGFIWGGLARIFLVHHVTWSVNSACHIWGRRPFKSNDDSRNNFLFGILALGEGWHNTHHAFPTSARHGLRWWQIDVSYWVIRGLNLLGLAWNIKLPSIESQNIKRRIPV